MLSLTVWSLTELQDSSDSWLSERSIARIIRTAVDMFLILKLVRCSSSNSGGGGTSDQSFIWCLHANMLSLQKHQLCVSIVIVSVLAQFNIQPKTWFSFIIISRLKKHNHECVYCVMLCVVNVLVEGEFLSPLRRTIKFIFHLLAAEKWLNIKIICRMQIHRRVSELSWSVNKITSL